MAKIDIILTHVVLATLILSAAVTIQSADSHAREHDATASVVGQIHHLEIQSNSCDYADATPAAKNLYLRKRPLRRVTQRIISFPTLSSPAIPKIVRIETALPRNLPSSPIKRPRLISPPQTAPPAQA